MFRSNDFIILAVLLVYIYYMCLEANKRQRWLALIRQYGKAPLRSSPLKKEIKTCKLCNVNNKFMERTGTIVSSALRCHLQYCANRNVFNWRLKRKSPSIRQCFLSQSTRPFWAGRILEWAGTFWLIINNTNLKTFLRMILRKIFKFVVTRSHLLWLKCTKFNFGWGSAPDPAGGAYSSDVVEST